MANQGEEGTDVDMMAAVAGEEYFNLKLKVFCLQANKNAFGMQFIECIKRSNFLVSGYYKKISEIALEMNLQENEEFSDPSFLLGNPPKTQ